MLTFATLLRVGFILLVFEVVFTTGFRLSNVTCPHNTFRCDNFKCISKSWLCDGARDCLDGKDELAENCADGATPLERNCSSTQFRCADATCIPKRWRCDGADDCRDRSDEIGCEHTCNTEEFVCANGQCVSSRWRCDGHGDCDDLSDEVNCTTGATTLGGGEGVFVCDGLFQVPKLWVCDGHPDCTDLTDEKDCDNSTSKAVALAGRFCDKSYVQCPNTACIPSSYICDGANDCGDFADELNCDHTKEPCEKMLHMRCVEGSTCVPTSLWCDGKTQCLDGSDETKCVLQAPLSSTTPTPPPSTTSTTATVAPHCHDATDFECGDGRCLDKTLLCNGVNDCRDGSDESDFQCGTNECERGNGGCAHICIDTRQGHYCACAKGYKLQGKYNCIDVNECEAIAGTCSQLCENVEGSYRCSCKSGYQKDFANPDSCKATQGEVYLLFSHSYDIRRLRLQDREMTSVVPNTRKAIAFDYLLRENTIVWSDRTDKKIFRASLTDPTDRTVLTSASDISSDGLAVDWVHRHIYYTDTVRSVISLLSWDGKWLKTIVKEDLGHPRAVVVAPLKSYIFWTDWGTNAKIERASLDGSSRSTIVTGSHVQWPNGIALDSADDRFYWCDGRLHTISSANLDGSDIKVVLYSPTFLHLPFSISVFEDHLYWVDWTNTAIFSANKFTGHDITNVTAGHMLESPKVVHVFHQYRQPEGHNVCDGHRCDHFCLRSEARKATCACADGTALMLDERTCSKVEEIERTSAKPLTPPQTRLPSNEDTTVPSVIFTEKVQPWVGERVQDDYYEEESDGSPRIGFIFGSLFGAVIAIGLIAGIYILKTRARKGPIRFHNSIYRKTTTDDSASIFSGGVVVSPGQFLFPGATTANSFTHLTEADDAPLTPNCECDEEDDNFAPMCK